MVTKNFKEIGNHILIIGKTSGHLYQSEFFREVLDFKEGPPPEINLFNEKNNGLTVLNLISKQLVKSVHDISSGGILVALSEMCFPSKIGVKIILPKINIKLHEYLFGEDQSRYIAEVKEENIEEVSRILKDNSIYFEKIGKTQEKYIEVENEFKGSLDEIEKLYKYWFHNYFGESV